MNIKLKNKYTMSDLIEFYIQQIDVKNKILEFDFIDIFTKEVVELISEDTECYIDEPVDDDLLNEEENPEGYSDFVLENNLQILCSGELFSSVILNTLYHKKDATKQDIIFNLNYYMQHDNFFNFASKP